MKKRVAVWMFGGIGTGAFSQGQPVLEALIRALSEEFEIVVYSQSPVNADYVSRDFTIVCASRNLKSGALRWLVLMAYFLRDHTRKKFSLVCAFWGFPGGFLATLLARLLFIPSMINLQGGDSVGIAKLKYGIMLRPAFRRCALWAYRHATVLTALTEFQSGTVRAYGVSRVIRVVPYGANPSLFVFSNRPPTGKCNFIHVSNYNLIKNPEMLLKSFAAIEKKKEARLRIVGGGYAESNCHQICNDLGIAGKVEFVGAVSYQQMADHYQWADVLLHTSWYEGQAIVIAEAAMSGVLIAGTAVGLVSDLGDSSAIQVPVGDFKLLAEKTLHVLDNEARAIHMREKARAWAITHDFAWTVSQYSEIINQLT